MEHRSPEWCEREYNPRLSVADAADYAPKWAEWARLAREDLPHEADLRYGPHPREVTDLFRAKDARAALVFIHGGYWRSFSKNEFSWVAEAFVARGVSVAVINYPLCPEVTVGDIAASCRRAVANLWTEQFTPAEKAALLVAGHSAGGYLTAAMAATDWTAHGLPPSPFIGGVPISGVFDPSPLIQTTINEQVRLTPDSAAALNLLAVTPLSDLPLAPVYGAEESSEFRRQSEDLARLWSHVTAALGVAKRNHFNVVEGMREPDSPVFKSIMRFIPSRV